MRECGALAIDILTALLWPAHEHHEVAHRFSQRASPVGELLITQSIDASSHSAFSRDALSRPKPSTLGENLAIRSRIWTTVFRFPRREGHGGRLQATGNSPTPLAGAGTRRKCVFATLTEGYGRLP